MPDAPAAPTIPDAKELAQMLARTTDSTYDEWVWAVAAIVRNGYTIVPARSTPAEPLDVPLKGVWVIDGDPQPSPEFFEGLGNALKDARARGDEVIVHQGIELRWRPIVIESHQVVWVDPGRDEPPESGFWRCACGATFAPDGVDEYAAHLTPDRGRIGRVQSPEDRS